MIFIKVFKTFWNYPDSSPEYTNNTTNKAPLFLILEVKKETEEDLACFIRQYGPHARDELKKLH